MIPLRRNLGKSYGAYLFIAPAVFLMILIIIVPSLLVILISFTDYTLLRDGFNFIGLENYKKMFGDESFLNSLSATFFYAALFIPAGFILGLWAAVALFEKKQFRTLLEVFYFMPVTSTLTAMAMVWNSLLNPIGVVNNSLSSIGISAQDFWSHDWVMFSLALISIWGVIGFNMVLFLAGLTSIPAHLYDAGRVDGITSSFDKFIYITWPMLGPTSMFVLVTNSINAFKLFDLVAILTEGRPDRASEVFLYLTFLEAFEYYNMGYGSALSLVFLSIVFIFGLLQTKYVDKKVTY